MVVCPLCHTRTPVPLHKITQVSANGLPIPARAGVVIVITCDECVEVCRSEGVAATTAAQVYTVPLD